MEELAEGREITAGALAAPTVEAGTPFLIGPRLKDIPIGQRYRALWGTEQVRLTIVDPLLVARADVRQQLQEDLERAQRVSHRNLVPVLAHGLAGSRFVIVEAEVDAVTVRTFADERSAQGQPLDRQTAYTVVAHVCNVLQAVHVELVHGYVTPDTVLVSPEGRIFLSSCGLGRLLPRAAAFSRFRKIGLLPNVPPEQMREPPVLEPGTDVFAAAALFVELATGHALLESGQPLEALDLGEGDDVRDCLERATAPSCAARPPDAESFKHELKAAIDAVSVQPIDVETELMHMQPPPPPPAGGRPNHGAPMPGMAYPAGPHGAYPYPGAPPQHPGAAPQQPGYPPPGYYPFPPQPGVDPRMPWGMHPQPMHPHGMHPQPMHPHGMHPQPMHPPTPSQPGGSNRLLEVPAQRPAELDALDAAMRRLNETLTDDAPTEAAPVAQRPATPPRSPGAPSFDFEDFGSAQLATVDGASPGDLARFDTDPAEPQTHEHLADRQRRKALVATPAAVPGAMVEEPDDSADQRPVYLVVRNGIDEGPYSTFALARMLEADDLNPQSVLRHRDSTTEIKLEQLPSLANACRRWQDRQQIAILGVPGRRASVRAAPQAPSKADRSRAMGTFLWVTLVLAGFGVAAWLMTAGSVAS